MPERVVKQFTDNPRRVTDPGYELAPTAAAEHVHIRARRACYHLRRYSILSRSWSALHNAVGGPPQALRASVWMAPCGRPVRPAVMETIVLSSLRNSVTSSIATGASHRCLRCHCLKRDAG